MRGIRKLPTLSNRLWALDIVQEDKSKAVSAIDISEPEAKEGP